MAVNLEIAQQYWGRFPDFLNTQQVAEICSVTPATVRKWCTDGVIRAYRFTNTFFVLKADLVAQLVHSPKLASGSVLTVIGADVGVPVPVVPDHVSVQDLEKFFGVARSTISTWERKGVLPPAVVKVGMTKSEFQSVLRMAANHGPSYTDFV